MKQCQETKSLPIMRTCSNIESKDYTGMKTQNNSNEQSFHINSQKIIVR